MVAAVSSGRLGGRVRESRRRRSLTLEELAERSGVSRAMISKLERGEKNPTLVVAARLAEGLGVTLSRLAGMEERREVVVVPRERRMIMRDPETGFERQLLSPNFGGGGVEFVRNVYPRAPPRESSRRTAGVSRSTSSSSGGVWAILGGEEYLLREGDALYFEADVTHRFDNVGEGECSYYLVIAAGR